MKISFKTFIVLLISGSIISCNSDSSKTSSASDSTTVKTSTDTSKPTPADTSTTAMNNNTNNSGDQGIINDLVTGNTKEIAWINAALSRSSNKELKSHASMMLKDHQKLASNVMDLVAKKNWASPPIPDTTNEVTINDKTGKDWDKAWTDKMVTDHSNLLDALNKAQGDAKDADLKALITKTKPVVQSHLNMVKALQNKMK